MRYFISTILFLIIQTCIYGQSCPCPQSDFCNKNAKPLRVFSFKNGKRIAVCGYPATKKDSVYSGFAVYECGRQNIIDEWGEIDECKIEKRDDSLLVKKIYNLPVGENFKYINTSFLIYKFYFVSDTIKEESYFRKDVRKYSESQIKKILNELPHLQKGNYDTVIVMADRLFWAYVSGSKDAERYLINFPEKYGPFDGAIAEDWDDIIATYKLWKSKNKNYTTPQPRHSSKSKQSWSR